ncbi:1,3-beta-glucanosyltransferase gas1 [Agyrium rufum]|nr:1,3-beta-glucanosyltransferase gas1 [Agyrium rufum]
MKAFGVKSAILAAASLLSAVNADVDPIVIKGSKFFYKTNGTEFFIRGVAYQQDVGGNSSTTTDANKNFVDPLADPSGCQRDLPYLVGIRTNAVRVYAIDTTKDHTECMTMFANAGIYVLADLSAPNISINRDSPEWTVDLYARYTTVVDTLAPFNNVLGFFAGNEVSNNVTTADAIPFVKAAVRDTKAYIKAKNYRPLGVGYATSDDPDIRVDLENYLNCGDQTDAIDFFGYNIYSWCGDSNFVESNYQARTKEFANYSIPAFFAEYGCIQPAPRLFTDTLSLFSSNMTGVWSGGFVYEYFQEANDYGLVSIDGNSVSTLSDYKVYSTQIAKVDPTGVNAGSYNPTNTAARACPTEDATFEADSSPLPPTPNNELCSCMVQNLTCVAKSDLSSDLIGPLFGTVCGLADGLCDGITGNGTTGAYGAFSVCNDTSRLSWAFNAYYVDQMNTNSANTDACDFGGNATTQAPSAPSACSSLLGQAGSGGTGTVSSNPTETGTVGGSAVTSTAAANNLILPAFNYGLISMGAYIVTAMLAGMGMILL